jgi:glycosyltransferase involved in cell wall biosynthesis
LMRESALSSVHTQERSIPQGMTPTSVRRILHVLWTGEIGGAERAVYQLALHQRRSGRAAAEIGFGQAKGRYCELARQSGIPVVDFSLRSGRDLGGLRRATRLFDAYDIHHFHAAEPVLLLASMRTRATRVYTHRAGRIGYGGRRALRYRIAGTMIRQFDAVTGTAQATTAIPALFRIPAYRVHRSWNGVDPELLTGALSRQQSRSHHGFASDAILIGTAAHLRELKRIDLLIDAAGTLKRDGQWQIVVLGDGPDRGRLEHLSHMSPVAERIRFVGMQPAVEDWLPALDIFVLPTGAEESFGNAVVEAMAVGLPSIVFADSPALADHIVDRETGFVVRTSAELAKRLQELIDDPSLRNRLGAAASRLVKERYSMKHVVERFDEIYATVKNGARE